MAAHEGTGSLEYSDLFGIKYLQIFSQRAYTDSTEKWQLVVACLKHFQMWVDRAI